MSTITRNDLQKMRPFLILWAGQALSMLGSSLVQFALIWYLTETTGSATVLALASFVGLMPQVLLGPFVGVLVDRWDRRLTMLAADSVIALATVVLALFFWLDMASLGAIYAMLFVRALGGIFHWSAMTASTSLMVPEKHLTRIQGLNQTLFGLLNIASAPLGALLLGILPLQGILAIDVVTAVFAIAPLFFIAVPQPSRTTANYDNSVVSFWTSFWTDLREGFEYIRRWKGLLVLTGMAMIVKIVLNPALTLTPLLITTHFERGALDLGLLEAVIGIGIVIGGVLLGFWGGFRQRIFTILTGLLLLGIALLLMGLAPVNLFGMAVISGFGVGFSLPFVDGPLMAILQANIAPEKQGRVMTLFGSLVSSTVPIGLLIAGPVADVVGVRPWFFAAGGGTLVMAAAGFFIPSLLNIEKVSDSEPAFAAADPVVAGVEGNVT